MITKKINSKTSIECLIKIEGETIEDKISRIINNNEPITDGAPIIYMERKERVNPDYDIRTDRFDAAIDAMDAVTASKLARRDKMLNPDKDKKSDVNAESIDGTKQDSNPGQTGS